MTDWRDDPESVAGARALAHTRLLRRAVERVLGRVLDWLSMRLL